MARKKKLGSKIYAICLAVYILILAGAIFYGLNIVWRYAEEYELAQPALTMDAYVEDLRENLWGEGIEETIKAMPHEMQTDEECAQIVQEMLSAGITYSRQAGSSDSGMTINYNLRCGDSVFGKVTLKEDESKTDQVEFGMLPWIIYEEEFDFTGLYTSIQVTAPASYTVELNGHKLGSEYVIEEGIHYNVLEGYYEDYPNLPTKVTYKFDNIIGTLEPVIYDEDGNVVTIDPNQDDSQFIKGVQGEQLDRLTEFANGFVNTYKKYICGVGSYQKLVPYMKIGSELDERMKLMADGLGYAHTASITINYVNVNNAISLGEGMYIIDLTDEATALQPAGEVTETENMKIIVTDTGTDIRAVTMDMY